MERRILIIDDEHQEDESLVLKLMCKKKGISLICDEFNVGAIWETDLLTDSKLDIDKVIESARNRFGNVVYSLIVCDWDLSDKVYDGPELMRKLTANNLFKNTPILFYSGLLDAKLNAKILSYKNDEITHNSFMLWLKFLINRNIKGSIERGPHKQHVVDVLLKQDSLDYVIKDVLSKYPDLTFHSTNPLTSYCGKTFSEVLLAIDNDEILSNQLKENIIQQCIAFLTEEV